jgi:hypothetical protein
MAFVITNSAKHCSLVQGHKAVAERIRPAGDQPFMPSLRTCNSSRSMPASAPFGIASTVMLHDGLRASVRVPGDVADRQQVAAGAIKQRLI